MKPYATLMMVLLAAPVARAAEALPPVAEVVAQARAAHGPKAAEVVCKVVVDTQLLDKTGKPEHDEHREGKATFRGDDMDIESVKVVRDGKEMTADEIAEERAKVQKDKQGEEEGRRRRLRPHAARRRRTCRNESFEVVRRETLWGRPAFVVKVRAQKQSPQQANGTMWIDAERSSCSRAELSPSAMPPHADWIKVQEQFVPGRRTRRCRRSCTSRARATC